MKDLIKLLRETSASNTRLRKILDRIENGTIKFSDTAKYSEIYSNLIGRIMSKYVLELSPEEREAVCTALLRESYDNLNDLLAQVQTSLDKNYGLHIKPQKAVFPAERVQQLAHSLIDPTVPDETIQRRANSGAANISKSFHDDYMKTNAKFRNDAGLKCYINRVTSGKCCPWCSDIAGRYVYGDHPDDVFCRHDNCDCTVTFENGRQRQDVWPKRTWEAPEIGDGAPPPTVLSEEEGKELQQRNLAQIRGLKINNSAIDNSGESGIIESGSEAMYRKPKSDKIEPMPRKQFRKIAKSFKQNGGIMQFDEITERYLDSKNAEAITYNANTILIRQNPSRASVFEELIHTEQYRNGRNDGSYKSRLECEIEAQKKLIKYSKAYKLTEQEVFQTQKALEAYENELREYYKNGGA